MLQEPTSNVCGIKEACFYLLDIKNSLLASCNTAPDYSEEQLKPILTEILLLGARTDLIDDSKLSVIKSWDSSKKQAYCLLLESSVLRPEQRASFVGSELGKNLCGHKLAIKIVDAAPGDISSELQMLSSLKPTTVVATNLFKKLALLNYTPQSIDESLRNILMSKLSDYVKVLDEESSAYLARFVSTFNDSGMLNRYHKAIDRNNFPTSAIPGILYGISIIQRNPHKPFDFMKVVQKWRFAIDDFTVVLDGLDRVFPIFKDVVGLDLSWLDSVVCVHAQFILRQCRLDPDNEGGSNDLLLMGKKLLQWHRVAISHKMPVDAASCLGQTVRKLEELSLQVPALTDTVLRYLRSEGIVVQGRSKLLQGQLIE